MSLFEYEPFLLHRDTIVSNNVAGELINTTVTTTTQIMGNLQPGDWQDDGIERYVLPEGLNYSDVSYFYTKESLALKDRIQKIATFGPTDTYEVYQLYKYDNFPTISASHNLALLVRIYE